MNKMIPKWLALYRVEKKLSNENYLIREVGTNHTQIVHRIRLRSYSPRHTIHDLQTIDQKNFVVDPKFPDEYRQPAIFDNARQEILWHPIMSVNPETDEVAIEPIPRTYGTLFTREPRVKLSRLQLPTNSDPIHSQKSPAPRSSVKSTQIIPKIADKDTKIRRILTPKTTTLSDLQKGPTKVILPKTQSHDSTKFTISPAAKLKAKTQQVLPYQATTLPQSPGKDQEGGAEIAKGFEW